MPRRLRVVGPGRAGGALSLALAQVGWRLLPPIRHGDPLSAAAAGVDAVLIATPDGAVAGVAARIDPVDTTTVLHCAGSLGLDVLAPHRLRASVHPLMTLPSAAEGAARLHGGWFALAGSEPQADALAAELVDDLGGRWFRVDDDHRALYHAAAVIASNHVVALLGQVERVAAGAGVPMGAFFDLIRASVDNVEQLGPRRALTGPVARGDWDTVARHVAALPEAERAGYEAMVELADRLVDRSG